MVDVLGEQLSSGPATTTRGSYVPRSRTVACRECHSRRVKCSGGRPCSNCEKAKKPADCVYPRKERFVKVSQRYVDDLVAENRRLRSSISQSETSRAGEMEHEAEQAPTPASSSPVPELASAPWFVNIAVRHTPILLGEASDSAFATRFRQAMLNPQHHSHLPRVHYAADDQVLALSDALCVWPSPLQARLLVNVALKSLGRWHHIVRRSHVLERLEKSTQNLEQMNHVLQAQFWALFAIGQMSSTRTPVTGNFPGLEYFAKATKVLQFMSERPTIETVETWILLSYYSLCLNRRHSAYNLAGSAVRVAVIMGLHLNVAESVLPDPTVREHRIRVWWTAYTFERLWATKLGFPVSIQDSDIEVPLPSDKILDNSDFQECLYYNAMVGLARISGDVVQLIYGKGSRKTSLPQRVHDILSALRDWLKRLPTELQISTERHNLTDQRAESLHLHFNQLTILATRPILLHVFRISIEATDMESRPDIPSSASTLSETCIRCARHSFQILTDSWINGTFLMFDYFYAQCLFASATVLVISSLLHQTDSQADKDSYEAAIQFLSQLQENGNFVAAEFIQHMNAIKAAIQSLGPSNQGLSRGDDDTLALAQDATVDMLLSDDFFQDLLSWQMPDLEFFNASLNADNAGGLSWPMSTSDTSPGPGV